MAINLDEHAVFIHRLQMDMVPLSVAKQAVQQAVQQAAESNPKLDEAIEMLSKAMSDINKTISND